MLALGITQRAVIPSLVFYLATWGWLPLPPWAIAAAFPSLLLTIGVLALCVLRWPRETPRWAAGLLAAFLVTLIFDGLHFTGIAMGIVPGDFMAFVGQALTGSRSGPASSFVTFVYNYLFMGLP